MKMKLDRLICYGALIFIGATGCDEGQSSEVSSQTQNFLGEAETESIRISNEGIGDPDAKVKATISNRKTAVKNALSTNSSDSKSNIVGEISTEAPVSVELVGMSKGELNANNLKWKVTNNIDENIIVSPVLKTEGLAVIARNLEMAEMEIAPEKSTEIELAAKDMPIQSMNGAGTVQIAFQVSTVSNPDQVVNVLSPMLYFRHTDDYNKVTLFTQDVLMQKHGGKIFSISRSDRAQKTKIGRVLDAGKMRDVDADDASFLVGEGTRDQYAITGASLDFDQDDENGFDSDISVEAGVSLENEANTLPTPFAAVTISAVSVKWCAQWTVTWTDGPGYAETLPARYTRAKLYDVAVSTTNPAWNGWLDHDGCAMMPTKINTEYTFKLGSAVLRNPDGNDRYIYVQPSGDTTCGWNYVNHNVTVNTPSTLPSTMTVTRAANTPEARIAAVARLPLYKWSTAQWQSYITLIRPSASVDTSFWSEDDCDGTGRISIDTSFPNPNGGTGTIDHSTYRFGIAHEMGHRQAWEVEGVKCNAFWKLDVLGNKMYNDCSRVPQWQQATAHACNCKAFASYNDNCLQNRGYTGNRQREAWANFYSAALFSSRTGACTYQYWRNIYKKNASGTPVWQPLAPVAWDCSTNETWMVSFCNDGAMTDKATNQDWMSFFWNAWTSSSNQLEMSELNDVWNGTSIYNWDVGYKWAHTSSTVSTLQRSALSKWGTSSGKYQTFNDKAFNARVNN